MKTLSEFKKRLQIGKKLECIHHLSYAGRNERNEPIYTDKNLGIREISIVQSNSFALKTNKKEPVPSSMVKDESGKNNFTEFIDKIVDSWCQYPKASECVFTGPDTLTILEEQRDGSKIPVLTYIFIEEGKRI